jgi:hypothetical protein
MNRNIFTLIIALFISAASFSQLSGTYYIPSGGSPSYPTIQAAVADLNTLGINGNVTFIVADDYTEAAPVGGIVLGSTLLNTNSVTYTITFQRSTGGTLPPKITAFTGTTTTLDGIWKIAGTDNVTINGIDLAEIAGNTDQTTRMEFGYALVKLNGGSTPPYDGCQNVTIKNSTITLNKYLSATTWVTCTGIYSGNHTATVLTTLNNIIADSDVHNNCKFFNNTITNVYNGISLNGWTSAGSPYNLYDNNNEIGVEGANTITHFANYGIHARYQISLEIANNNISSIGSENNQTSQTYGIYVQNTASADAYNNTVTIQPIGGNSTITGLNVTAVSDAAFTGSIHHNTVQNCTNSTATYAGFNGVVNNGSLGNVNIYNNNVTNNTFAGTGAFSGVDCGGQAGIVNLYNNTISGNSKTGTSGTFTCMRVSGLTNNYAYDNLIYSNSNTTTAGATQGGNMYGISINNSGTIMANVYKNQIYDLSTTGGGSSALVYGINAAGPATTNIYNNYISDLRAPNATTTGNTNVIAGINIGSSGTNYNVFYNTVYLNTTSTGANFWTSAFYAHITPTVDLRNNIFVNVSTPNGTGIASAYRRSTAANFGTYSTNSNANVFYAGDPEDATHSVYCDGTTPYGFAAFQALVGPVREAGSYRELPPFVNVASTPYDLHLTAGSSTACESNGLQITSPVSITVDYDGNTRSGTPDIGADEFAGLFAGVLNPSGVTATVMASSQINVSFTPNPSNNNVVIVWNLTGVFTIPAGAPPANVGDPFAGGNLLYNGLTSPSNHTGLTGATSYYYKAFSYDGSAYSNGLLVGAITNIAAPTNFTATSISSSQIDLAWIKNAFNNDVIVATNSSSTFGQPVNGTSYSVGGAITGGGTVVYIGPASAFSHTGLSSYTAYYYEAWSVDQGNNNVYSPTGAVANATTQCAAVSVPYNESFEYGGPIGCGSILDANNDFSTWQTYYNVPASHSGTYLLRIFAYINNDYYFTNGLQLTGGQTYEVKFWYRTQSVIGTPHQFEVKWGTTPSVAGMTGGPIYYNTMMTPTTTYYQVTCASITPSVTGTYYIGFHDFNPINAGHQLYLDDISVTAANFPVASEWTGAINSDWFINNNWNPSGVPGSTTAVTIPGALTNYPTINAATTAGSLTVASGASLLDNGNLAVSGSTTVERAYAGGEWHLISSPVANETADAFFGLYLQNHTESTNAYTDITNPATPLNVMQGYALYNAEPGTAQFNGLLNTGNVGALNNVTRNNQGWNLVGNPYASYIDWDAASGWTKTNVDNATYRHVNSATWASYVGGVGANGGTRYIAPCQGFFIGVTDGQTIGTLNMNNSVRTHTSSPFYKDEVADIVRLEVSGNGFTDETVIRFLSAATTGFDGEWDAHKLFGSVPSAPAIYSSENGKMSINSLPPATSIPLGVYAGTSGEFTISATETTDFPDVILEDIALATFTNLKSKSYTFNYEVNSGDRFILHFSPTGVPENEADLVNIYSNQRDVYVSVPDNTSGEIIVYNLLGQEVAHTRITGSLNKLSLVNGNYYLVRVLGNDINVTRKIFVK